MVCPKPGKIKSPPSDLKKKLAAFLWLVSSLLLVGSVSLSELLPFACINSTAYAAPKRTKRKKAPATPIFPSSRNTPPQSSPEQNPEDSLKSPLKNTQNSEPAENKHGARGVFGLVSGLGHVSGAVFVFGGDYTYRLRPQIDLSAGLLHWNNVYSDASYSLDHSVTTIDGGADYSVTVTESLIIKGTGRLGLAISSAATRDVIIGIPEQKDSTVNAMVATLGSGVFYRSGSFEFGGELRKPVFFSELQDSGTHVYLLASAAMGF